MSSPMQRSTSNPSLPDDLLLSCIARVSRLYYPILSLVSKSFRSLIGSEELYKARSLLGHTDSCLYVCFKVSPSENPSWFTLVRKPNQTLTSVTVSYALANVSIPQSPFAQCSDLVAVGSNIYNIVGFGSPSFSVSILDCRSYTWHNAPSLHVKLRSPSATVVDGKIYVSGYRNVGLYTLDSTLEVFEFDTKTQIWDPLPSPCSEATHDKYYFNKRICFDGKLREISDKGVISYNFKEGRWEWDVVGPAPNHYMFLDEHCCEIENVWYSVLHGSLFMWYDTEEREWRDLKGMVGLPKISPDACVRLVDCSGKMMVLWDEDLPSSNKKMIWCAEIVLEKNETFGIWGQVEWVDTVLTVPTSYKFFKGLAAMV